MRELSGAPLPTFVVDDPGEAARRVAEEIAGRIAEAGSATGEGFVLGCATGHTPIATYAELARRAADLDSSRLLTFNLDEYEELPPEHPSSFESFMRAHLFDALGLPRERTHFPRRAPGEAPEAAAARYEEEIRAAGGIDLQLLGIGRNGHIAFNEPGSTADCRTRRVELDAVTREVNARDFVSGESVPRRALTMGVATILEARALRVLAFGEGKAEVVRRALREDPSPALPATFLRGHGDVELWLDEAAAAAL